jgi:Rod binding domain-containing protein
MSMDFSISSLTPFSPVDTLDVNGLKGAGDSPKRIHQVAKAMESLFTSQLMNEMGKGLGGITESKDSDQYSDFIQQAMTQGVTQGGGFGLAKTIENYLNQREHPQIGKMPLKTNNLSYHVHYAE